MTLSLIEKIDRLHKLVEEHGELIESFREKRKSMEGELKEMDRIIKDINNSKDFLTSNIEIIEQEIGLTKRSPVKAKKEKKEKTDIGLPGLKTKWNEDVIDCLREQAKHKTLAELVRVVKTRFNLDTDERKLYQTLWRYQIKVKRKIRKDSPKNKEVYRSRDTKEEKEDGSDDTDEEDIPEESEAKIDIPIDVDSDPMQREIRAFIKNNPKLSNSTMIQVIARDYGVKIKPHTFSAIRHEGAEIPLSQEQEEEEDDGLSIEDTDDE